MEKLHTPRQAGAEIEITEEMLEAGISAVYDVLLRWDDPEASEKDHKRALAAAFRAMVNSFLINPSVTTSGQAATVPPKCPKPHRSPMIRSVTIAGYRGFSQFEMADLGRINLLVGRNNGGKTSVLEMLNLLASGGDPGAILRIVSRRSERIYAEQPSPRPEVEFEVSHLFNGHDLRIGAEFAVTATNQSPARSVKCVVAEATKEAQERLDNEGSAPSAILALSGKPKPPVTSIPLTRRWGLCGETFDPIRRRQRGYIGGESSVQFISTESLTFEALALMWNQIQLTDAQNRVVKALQFIEPKIESIGPLFAPEPYYYYSSRGGFIVKLAGMESPIPIGSLGDGTWRILALSIALSRAKDGVLLVDEIDTGLHFSVMADMWRLIYETARALNVQVFATTHSYDCVHSLATICDGARDNERLVTIQRIDAGSKKAFPYDGHEIRLAADHHIEMR